MRRHLDFYGIIVPVGSVIYPVFEESSITPWRVAVSSTQLKERSSAPLPVGRVLYAGWRLVLAWGQIFLFCFGCVVHILDIFFFLFRYFLLGSAYSREFSLACLIFYFSQQLYCYWVFLFRYPLQDLQKATTWGDMCGSRRQRLVQQLLSSRANSSVKKYVLHFIGFLKYWRSQGIIVTLPCDSLLISEYLSYLQDAKNSYAVFSLAFFALTWVHDIIFPTVP